MKKAPATPENVRKVRKAVTNPDIEAKLTLMQSMVESALTEKGLPATLEAINKEEYPALGDDVTQEWARNELPKSLKRAQRIYFEIEAIRGRLKRGSKEMVADSCLSLGIQLIEFLWSSKGQSEGRKWKEAREYALRKLDETRNWPRSTDVIEYLEEECGITVENSSSFAATYSKHKPKWLDR